MDANIDISPIAAELEATVTAVHPLEFSGFGFVEPGGDVGKTNFKVYDWILFNIGSTTLTTIPIKDQIRLKYHPDRKFMRVWIHRHPLGNGIPGPQCWSSTDENAIAKSPMGTVPELMPWMLSVVRTPKGWVGRFDIPGKQTHHLEVVPSMHNHIEQVKYVKSDIVTPSWKPNPYWEDEDDELYDTLFGNVQLEEQDNYDDRGWWSRIFGNRDTGKDGDQSKDIRF